MRKRVFVAGHSGFMLGEMIMNHEFMSISLSSLETGWNLNFLIKHVFPRVSKHAL